MRQSYWAGVVLVLSASAVPAFGQVKLEWKFKEGDKFYLEERVVLKQTMKIPGTELKQELDHTRVTRFTVKKKTDDTLVLEQKIESEKIHRVSGSAEPEGELLKKLEGATFTVTLNSKMKVTNFEGYDALIKKLAKKDDVGKAARTLMPQESLSKPVEAFFGFLPTKAVAKGDEWTHEFSLRLGPLGTLKQENGYTSAGDAKAEGKEVIKLEVVNKTSSFTPAAAGDLQPFRVTKGKLRVNPKKTKGTVYFSSALGRLVKAVKTMNLDGTLTIDVKGNTLTMDIAQEETVTSRILDKNPLK
jgi:hypothetical protein